MNTTVINYKEKYTRYLYLMMAGLLFITAIIFLISPVNAKITLNSTLNVSNVTENSITWQYSYLTTNRPIGASLDGVIIEGWKTDYVYNYTASDLEPNTTHEFCIFGDATSNCETGTTLINIENLIAIIYKYIFAIICCILLITGTFIKRNEPALASGMICFIGLGVVGSDLIGQIIYIMLLIVSFYMSFED